VDDDVDLAVVLRDVVGNEPGRVRRRDVPGDVAAAQALGGLLEVVLERRDIEADDGGAVASERLHVGQAETARRTGDERDLAGEWLLRVLDGRGRRDAGGTDAEDLARDVRGLGGEEEAERRLKRRLRALGDVDEVG